MTSPRVGVVGARRRRQGLGPFVVRDLVAAGATVPGLVATTEASGRRAAADLSAQFGVEARAYPDVDAMVAAEHLDAVAILSPAETHRAYLEAALDAGLHVLCEKPLLWDGRDLARVAEQLVGAFDAGGLVLWENCQWPYTLPAFEALHPGALGAPPRTFEMELQPASSGRQMLGDCLPHVLSLLQAVVPGGAPRVEEPAFSTRDPAAESLRVTFRFCTSEAVTRVRAELRGSDARPRRAAYALDGRWARREVSLPEYRLSFRDRERTVAAADPLRLLVEGFVAAIRGGDAPRAVSRGPEIAERMRLLAAIVEAYEGAGRGGG
ncbi:MAG: Gfo/Idh/MocA family oxidoreductase [Deltaproteobacteria bacterium]|nr:MAG: Gfo/Idh/MocA family oxidoreductase [Deltaproteobacteria bacterium]